ncbi:uncharacterized protein LOC128873160 [Hylaeus volcanicus]|uniref:uncharacterized protein LOC128873160 n=1 Tax=Hylaeus volcanicus TaxID=313075 RepID=UPI0023B7E2CB|nr:uncharacterized protein LOC128873160 [Hylaeus volcanicus]
MPSGIWNILLLLIISYSFCASDSIDPQVDRQSGSSLSDVVQRNLESVDGILNNEKISKEGSSVRNRGQLGFNEQKQDEKRYNDQDTVREGFDKERHSLGESEAIDQGKNSFQRRGSLYYKKGFQRTGFSNNYHKDESGNNSSFYEDSNDEGGRRSSGNSDDYYRQKSLDSFKDGAHDVSYTGRDRVHQGIYDNRKNMNAYRDYHGGYHNDLYTEDGRNYAQEKPGRYFDRNGKEIYYYRDKLHPSSRFRNNRYELLYRDYNVDKLPRDYYKEDPYVAHYLRHDRYFPSRQRDYESELFYPRNRNYDRIYRGDSYDDEYLNKYRNSFSSGYYQF